MRAGLGRLRSPAAALALCLAASAARAEDAAKPSPQWTAMRAWLEHLKSGLTKTSVERYRKNRRVAIVAAVRGREQRLDDPDEPYLKSGRLERAMRRDWSERGALQAAIDRILSGDAAGGRKLLEEFEAGHADSEYLPEVRQARKLLDSAGPAPVEPPAAETPAPKPTTPEAPAAEPAAPEAQPTAPPEPEPSKAAPPPASEESPAPVEPAAPSAPEAPASPAPQPTSPEPDPEPWR